MRPPDRNDDTIHFQGCLLDQRKTPAKPVPDVKIVVEDDSGKVVGNDTSDKTGVFDIALPGKSIDNLGKTFTIKIDSDTLPEGTKLRDPKQVALEEDPQPRLRRLRHLPDRQGRPPPVTPAPPYRRCSSPSVAWCSPCCSRWAPSD